MNVSKDQFNKSPKYNMPNSLLQIALSALSHAQLKIILTRIKYFVFLFQTLILSWLFFKNPKQRTNNIHMHEKIKYFKSLMSVNVPSFYFIW